MLESLIINIQIKTTITYYLTPIRIAIFKKIRHKCWSEYEEKRTMVHCWWEYKLLQPLWETAGRFLKNLKIALACEPKGHRFDSQSGHMPGLQARFPVGNAREATTH